MCYDLPRSRCVEQLLLHQLRPVNSNTTGTITPMFSSYDWMKPNLKQKAGTARGKWLVRKDWGKLRGSEKFVFERKYA